VESLGKRFRLRPPSGCRCLLRAAGPGGTANATVTIILASLEENRSVGASVGARHIERTVKGTMAQAVRSSRLLLASLLLARMVSIATAQTRTPHSAATCTLRRTSSQNPMDWRKDAIRAVRDECSRALASGAYDCKDRDMYQFGIFGGKSVKSLLFYSNCSRSPLRRFFGFDSFRGLPDEDRSNFIGGVKQMYASGKYSSAAALKLTGQPLLDRIEQYVGINQIRHYGVSWVVGFYNESLTRMLPAERGMKPASYVDIDADLYTSSLQALEWLLAHNLIVPGTVIGYDDWSVSDQANGGERRAHEEALGRTLKGHKVLRVEGCGPNAACFQVASSPRGTALQG
jgi:hypothetical protein